MHRDHEVAVVSPTGSSAYQGNLIRSGPNEDMTESLKTDEGDGGYSEWPPLLKYFLENFLQNSHPQKMSGN